MAYPKKEVGDLKGHDATVYNVHFNRDGNYAVTCGQDRALKLWNPHKGSVLKTYNGHGHEVLDCAIAHDNNRIVSCGGDRLVFLWDVASGRIIRKFRGHTNRVNAVGSNADFSVIATGSYDGTTRLWDNRSNSNEPIQILSDFKDSVSHLEITECEIIAGCIDGSIRSYDLRAGTLTTDAVGAPATCVQQSHDGNCLLVGSLDSRVRLLDKFNGELLNEFRGHSNTMYKVDCLLTGDDAFVISASDTGTIYIWDLVEGQLTHTLHGHQRACLGLSMHPEENMLLSSSADGTVKIWK
eukprot:GFYU01017972.1.p1 GENE.GFYU01017972.1~~GFYU01017972.1.p1  ORF type:complete len:340 (-),score=32.30 GFYU01017972.1:344-1231(-)